MSNIWTVEKVQQWIDDAGYNATVSKIIRYKVGKQLRTDIEVTCVDCGKLFQRNWYDYRRSGNGRCKVCNHKKIGPPPQYRNSIWDSGYKEQAMQYGLTNLQMQTIMPMSNQPINLLCPYCNSMNKVTPNHLFSRGFSCSKCGDGISYPNKFMYSVLHQLNIDYQPEYKPRWSKNKQYDIFIEEYSMIIEMHGRQHYDSDFSSLGGKTLEEEQYNDYIKKYLAKQNGIKNYIVIDCRKSEQSFIKENIIASDLIHILNIIESDINWDECNKYATNSNCRLAAQYWNKGMQIYEIAALLNVNRNTITKYLKKMAALGLCDYTRCLSISRANNSEQHRERQRHVNIGKTHSEETKHKMSKSHIGKRGKAVFQYSKTLCFIKRWNSMMSAEKELHINHGHISQCCNGIRKTAGGYVWLSEEQALAQLTQQND